MSVSHKALGCTAVKLRFTRSSLVATFTRFRLPLRRLGRPEIPWSVMMRRMSFVFTISPRS
jgi:hypothetical protein